MIAKWTDCTKVRFNLPDGARAIIDAHIRNGFYQIIMIPSGKEAIAHEGDLIEGWEE